MAPPSAGSSSPAVPFTPVHRLGYAVLYSLRQVGDRYPQGRVREGLLDRDEFDLRVGQAFAARTYADLAAVTADLPAGLPAGQPPPRPLRRRARREFCGPAW